MLVLVDWKLVLNKLEKLSEYKDLGIVRMGLLKTKVITIVFGEQVLLEKKAEEFVNSRPKKVRIFSLSLRTSWSNSYHYKTDTDSLFWEVGPHEETLPISE